MHTYRGARVSRPAFASSRRYRSCYTNIGPSPLQAGLETRAPKLAVPAFGGESADPILALV